MRKAYEEYVSFNDVWITSIPITWQSHKMKHLFCERSEKGYPHEQLLVASQNMGVVPKTIYGSRTVEAQKDLQLLKLVKIGDFVISLRSFEGGIEYAYYQGIISPAYTVLTTKGDIQKGYFRYLAKSTLFVKLLTLCVTGIREGQNIDYSKLKNHLLPVPPREEQEQIVRFLDWKISSINKLINLKQQEINNLKKLKKATISDAITHGLDKTVPMKDSGITWLGNIPKYWEMKRLKTTGLFDNGLTYSPVDITDESGVLVLRSANIQNDNLDFRDCVYVVKVPKKLTVKQNDIIICSRNGSVDLVGKCAMITDQLTATFGAFMIRYRSNINSKFALYVLRETLSSYKNLFTTSTINQLTKKIIGQINIPVPPREEQEQIVRFLDARCAEIDRLITENQAQITNLHDLKSSLIADVVTGQIDVRDVEIPDYEQVEETLYESDDNATLQSEDEIPEEV